MSTKKPYNLTVGALFGLKAILSRNDLLTDTADIYRAGCLLDNILPETAKPPAQADAKESDWTEWANESKDVELTEKQRETIKTALKAAAGKQMLAPGKHTNKLLEQFGLAPEE